MRIDQVRDLMAQSGTDLVCLTPSADLAWLTGLQGGRVSERPCFLALAPEKAAMFVAQLEAPLVQGLEGIEICSYGETDDAFSLLRDWLGARCPQGVAVSAQMWAAHLLRLQAVFAEATYGVASSLIAPLRMRKSALELDLLAEAARRTDRVFNQVIQMKFAGCTEHDVAQTIESLLQDAGLVSWGAIVASGPNAASPHHETGRREIHEGDALVLDFGGALDGYHSDITRTVHVGTPDETFLEVYRVVQQGQQAGVDAVAPAVPARDVDVAARSFIDGHGYGDYFIHRTGHGIGLDVHEEPYIVAGNDLPLAEGMTFSIEPGVYVPGKCGVRIEDIVAVETYGASRLNMASRDLIIVH